MRITQTTDYKALAKLNKTVHDIHVLLYPQYFKPYDFNSILNFFEKTAKDPNSIFLLAEDDGSPFGYVWLTIRDRPETPFTKASKSLYIHQISVDQKHSGKGVGTALIAYIEQLAKDMGANKIELDYWIDNTTAKHFYKKLGFVTDREIVHKDVLLG
jgi:diamine N-acetyltransferase